MEEEIDLWLAMEWLVNEKVRNVPLLPRYKQINVGKVVKEFKDGGWSIPQVIPPDDNSEFKWWIIQFERPKSLVWKSN